MEKASIVLGVAGVRQQTRRRRGSLQGEDPKGRRSRVVPCAKWRSSGTSTGVTGPTPTATCRSPLPPNCAPSATSPPAGHAAEPDGHGLGRSRGGLSTKLHLADVTEHLARYAGAGSDGHVFLGPQGGRLRRSNFRDDWIKARTRARLSGDVHFHDLRHTGNTLAAAGASTRELMTRMGHSTARAALIYQHMTADRDRAIADRLGAMIRERPGGAGA